MPRPLDLNQLQGACAFHALNHLVSYPLSFCPKVSGLFFDFVGLGLRFLGCGFRLGCFVLRQDRNWGQNQWYSICVWFKLLERWVVGWFGLDTWQHMSYLYWNTLCFYVKMLLFCGNKSFGPFWNIIGNKVHYHYVSCPRPYAVSCFFKYVYS